jgi:L-alanine-DL-glutamate epimerase-like enolase superfamily enzyme
VDATTCGGVTGAIEAIHIAAAGGKTVLPHVFPPLHIHLACAFPNVEAVEIIPQESGADPLQALLRNCPAPVDGKMSPSEEPGVGIALNWEAIEGVARRVAVISADG